jgi:hypothetical protein
LEACGRQWPGGTSDGERTLSGPTSVVARRPASGVHRRAAHNWTFYWCASNSRPARAAASAADTLSRNGAGLSPNGRLLAYASNESGRYEIHVQRFPSLSGKWQVSTEGGREPVWARNPKELFYRNGDKMIVVDVVSARLGRSSTALRGGSGVEHGGLGETDATRSTPAAGRWRPTATALLSWAAQGGNCSPEGHRALHERELVIASILR